MPASAAGYEYPSAQEAVPAGAARRSSRRASTRRHRASVTPYWSDISGAMQSTWHPPASVDQDTPEKSHDFIEDVLEGKALL